jgi:hypothetical protein
VKSGLAALAAEFIQLDFIRDINLVAVGDIILGFADGTDKSKYLTCTLLGHRVLILREKHLQYKTGNLKPVLKQLKPYPEQSVFAGLQNRLWEA